MENNEAQVGGSPLDGGTSPEVGKAIGKVSVNSQAAIDSSAFKELNKEFKSLSTHITKFKQDLPSLISDTKKWATELGKVAKNMKAIGSAQGGTAGSYLPQAGALTTNVGSGNTVTSSQTVNYYEAPSAAAGAGIPTKGQMRKEAYMAAASLGGDVLGAMDARASRGASYSLSADRMNMMYQQMYGGTQNQTYKQFREPLQKYKLGVGGINTLLGLQASTGLDAQRQAGSVEAMRAASGYAYSTEQLAGMTKSLAGPESSNQMFMMLGTGMYGIGGKQRTQQQVYQDIIKRTGLGNEKMLKGAFQQGSMTRSRLSMAGLAEDQQDLLLQYAQENVTYQKKGGKGFYDPSKKSQRELMGVENNYANQAEESTRVQVGREENFYKRQNDNFANFEKMTQAATKALGMFEEKLSSISGAGIVSKKHRDVFGTSFNWGKKIGGAAMMAAGVGLSGLSFGTSLGLTVGGAAMMAGGDPVDSVARKRRGKGVWGVRKASELGGDATVPEPAEVQLSANNKSKLAQLDPKLREPLKKMLLANPKLEIGDAKRSGARQDSSFRRRYSKAPAGTSKKTKDADRIWNGEVWIYDKHAENGPPMAPPGQSMHEIGLAADLSQSENEWVRANAASFGLVTGATQKGAQTDEPFHVQPGGIPFGRNEYEGGQGVSSSPTGTAVTSGSSPVPSVSGGGSSSTSEISTASSSTGGGGSGSVASSNTSLASPSTFAYAGMSMGEVIGSGSVYATSNLQSSSKPSSSYPNATAGGDPTVPGPISIGSSRSSANSYNITISPNFNIQSSGNGSFDINKMAKDVANILEREVRMTMLRTS